MKVKPRTSAWAVVAAFILMLGGCASQDGDHGRLAVIAGNTNQAETVRFEMTTALTLPWMGAELGSRTEGVLDVTAEAVQATYRTLPSETDHAGGARRGEYIAVGGHRYERGDFARLLQPGLPEGQWLRLPVDLEWAMEHIPGGGGQLPPTVLLERLGDVGGQVSDLGRDEVRGTAAQRWRVETTLGALRRADVSIQALGPLEGRLSPPTSAAPVVIDIWADDQDLLRRLRIDTDLTAVLDAAKEQAESSADDQSAEPVGGDLEEDMRSVIDIELFDFGADVTVSAPPDSEIHQ